jgi:hypothetical protein
VKTTIACKVRQLDAGQEANLTCHQAMENKQPRLGALIYSSEKGEASHATKVADISIAGGTGRTHDRQRG